MDRPDETNGKIHSRDVTNESCRACLGRKLVIVESFLVKSHHLCANVAKARGSHLIILLLPLLPRLVVRRFTLVVKLNTALKFALNNETIQQRSLKWPDLI